MTCVAEWVVHCGDDVVEAIKMMETWPHGGSGEKKLAVSTFRCLEAMYDAADFQELATSMRDESVKQTSSRLRSECARIVRARWWKWILMHPELKDNQVHAERSVSLCHIPCALCFASCVVLVYDCKFLNFLALMRNCAFICSSHLFFLLAGSLAEVPSLEASLTSKDDCKVNLSGTRWRWTEHDPWPPLTAVMRTPIWSAERYAAVRLRLLSAIPSPEIVFGGQYVTVDLHPSKGSTEPTTEPVSGAEPSTQGSGVVRKVAKRAAAPVGRFGLIHIAAFSPKSPLPSDLTNLPYKALIIEAGSNDFADGVHPQVTRLLNRGVPALVCGEKQDVQELLQYLKDGLDEVRVLDMELCRPPIAGETLVGRYRYHRYQLVMLYKMVMPWKVCSNIEQSSPLQCFVHRLRELIFSQ